MSLIIIISNILGNMSKHSISPKPWILENGIWDDNGKWDDNKLWKDN